MNRSYIKTELQKADGVEHVVMRTGDEWSVIAVSDDRRWLAVDGDGGDAYHVEVNTPGLVNETVVSESELGEQLERYAEYLNEY
ncbi:MAG: hypothetical protein ABEJ22_03475 [Haloferacaceae archaeon]